MECWLEQLSKTMSVLMVKRLRTSLFRPRFPGGAETENRSEMLSDSCAEVTWLDKQMPGRFPTRRKEIEVYLLCSWA